MKLKQVPHGFPSSALLTFILFVSSSLLFAADSYVETGSLRMSNQLSLEGIYHQLRSGWHVQDSSTGRDKEYSKGASALKDPDDTEWGVKFLSELSARFTPHIAARGLFEIQEYADRFWRPINAEHYYYDEDKPIFVRELEGRIDEDNWFLHGFSGVGHSDWKDKGDFFGLYREAIGESDYLGSSGYFGIYPDSWREDVFHNLSRHAVPKGVEGGANLYGLDVGAAAGNELMWGYDHSYFGRVGFPIKTTKLTFVYMDDDVPASFFSDDERKRAGALSWTVPFEAGHRIDVGLMYQPFRAGKQYQIADEAENGTGLQGSSWNISQKTAEKKEGLAGRLRLEGVAEMVSRYWVGVVDVTHAGILAGNKDELGLELGTDIIPTIKWKSGFTYRKPIEGPIPFLYEGTPDNVGNIVSNPRGPESPFTVDWTNREARILMSTFWFDPTPITSTFQYEPTALQNWNLNPEEDAGLTLAFQHRMSDYPTSTDRQSYYDANGNIVWESAGTSGAWATDHPLHEFRVLGHGKKRDFLWTLGFAGGQSPAGSGVAYRTDTTSNKSITEYVSVEGKLDFQKWSVWANYGTGVWGPEPNIDPWFGNSFDRVIGLGTRYNFTSFTSWDVSYIGAHQTDDEFFASSLGSYDEIRTVLTHKFGFLFQFQRALNPGTQVP